MSTESYHPSTGRYFAIDLLSTDDCVQMNVLTWGKAKRTLRKIAPLP
jgi:hypothetical protein